MTQTAVAAQDQTALEWALQLEEQHGLPANYTNHVALLAWAMYVPADAGATGPEFVAGVLEAIRRVEGDEASIDAAGVYTFEHVALIRDALRRGSGLDAVLHAIANVSPEPAQALDELLQLGRDVDLEAGGWFDTAVVDLPARQPAPDAAGDDADGFGSLSGVQVLDEPQAAPEPVDVAEIAREAAQAVLSDWRHAQAAELEAKDDEIAELRRQLAAATVAAQASAPAPAVDEQPAADVVADPKAKKKS